MMTGHGWVRVEGMIIARALDPQEVAEELASRGILAQLEWFERSPQLLGIVVSVQGGAVAVIDADAESPRPGPDLQESTEELAVLFDAEVRLGSCAADHLPEGESPLADAPSEDSPVTSRVVEIGHTPASSVPLLAALEGVDIADEELPDGQRILLAELPPERTGWNFGDVPLVSLSVAEGEFQAFLVTDDDPENVVSHNWGMLTRLVPGSHADASTLPADVAGLVGDRDDLVAIASHVPGSDAEAFVAASRLQGADAVRAAVVALGLDEGVAGFLTGGIPLAEVQGAEMHLARGISNAIGRSVDIMLKEPDSPTFPIWDAYHTTAVERPWLVRIGASVEAAAGAVLLALAIRAEKPRSGWTKVGGVLGSLMIVDSVAEVSLAKYLGMRDSRRSTDRA